MKIRTKWDKSWTITEIYEFDNKSQTGVCDPNSRIISIKKDRPDMFKTFVHELIHAISFDYDLELTENQVIGLENGICRALKLSKKNLAKLYSELNKVK